MKRIIVQINKFISYLWGKKTELKSMDERDILLAKVVMDIHRKRTHSEFIYVPLFSLFQIHPINRDNSLQETQNRANVLQAHKAEILNLQRLSKEKLAQFLPSVSAIKAVRENAIFIAYEGNGRLVALQEVFSPDDNIHIEIEEYCFANPEKILRRMNRVRQLHNLILSNDNHQT